jgi:poly(hydroxyalkanoate) depolymerase family esterase
LKIYDELPTRSVKAISLREPSRPTPTLDISALTDTIQRALDSAGLDTGAGPLKGVTDTIEQALSAARLMRCVSVPDPHRPTIDGVTREIRTDHDSSDGARIAPTTDPEREDLGEFISRSFTNGAGTRAYKLYVPGGYSELSKPVPMVVMLHGCTQSPDDFAAGTRMNALADRHGFLVVYPAQAANANGSKCWNWFRSEDQNRDRGEPSLIAGITREVASIYRVDARRIFVAGLSAGAAMAVTLGVIYPELYAGVGAHSGLPYGAAHDMPSALSAMKSGRKLPGTANPLAALTAGRPQVGGGVPTIVFHGDNDHTVDVRNGAAIVEQATRRVGERSLCSSVQEGVAADGRTFSRTLYTNAANQPVVEHWLLHRAGHAWSGGSPRGSFADPCGPDASAEMIRFFFSLLQAGTA